MKIVNQLKKKDLVGKKVLIRVDYNVPVKKGEVVDTFRIEQSLPTINYLLEKGARVILVSHLGDDGKESLLPIAKYLNKLLATKLIKDIADKKKIEMSLNAGEVVLLENIRRNNGEKENDPQFAKELASLADIYVNDAFSVSHRAHASVVGVAKYLPRYAGLLFAKEFKNLSRVLKPKGKFLVILGGLKFQTKIPLIKKFLKTADQIFIGGALANSFMKALDRDIGASVCDSDVSYIKPFLKYAKKPVRSNGRIVLPTDVVKNRKNQIVDIGPESLKQIKELVKAAKLILWNGPMGWFEIGDRSGTLEVAKIIAGAKGVSIVGGGDTLAAIEELKLRDKFGFVSTAGGAMLDFLATGSLPGIKALN